MTEASLADIRAFRLVTPTLATAGQPTPGQFAAVARAGYRLVVNLARPDSPDAVADEAERWAALGLPYLALPVDFKDPRAEDFARFRTLLDAHRDQPVFVHCAYNWRVSAFVFLYRVLVEGVAREHARRDLEAVWTPDEVWSRFIEERLAGHPAAAVQPPAPGG